jgi:hypothetical protein
MFVGLILYLNPEVAFINNPKSRLQVDFKSTTSRVASKALVFSVFMNNCLESTLESTLRC